ncbi:TPA: hypothetical protein ACH3X1_014761 [Trebouxia sp. C0004]
MQGIDTFSKDFVLIPAHKGLHWTLIVVCYPSPAYRGQHRGVLHLDSLPVQAKERELIGTPYHPGGSAIDDFIKNLTPAVRKYVQDNAPEEWWTDVKQVYKKSLQYELNQRAAVTVHTDDDCEPDVGLDIASESEHDNDYLLEHDIEHGGWKHAHTPPSV